MELGVPDWPAPAAQMSAARRFLRDALDDRRVVVAGDSDVDGLAAAVLLLRTLGRLGTATTPAVAWRGEHVHMDAMRARLGSLGPSSLVVVDMGSRDGTILPGVPTMVIDHHQPSGTPGDALLVSAYGAEPVAPTSLLVWHILRGLAPMRIDDLSWLALLGTVADLGAGAPFPEIRPWMRKWGRTAVSEAIALLNAARRAGSFRGERALAVLLAASEPADIAQGRVPGVDVLRACREEVAAETTRCSRTRPRFAPGIALIRFTSAAQVHPLVAVRWARRLPDHIVIAANDGYLPGRVNFAVRSTLDVNLVDLLRSLPVGPVEGELGNGHPKATGGSVPPADFARIITALGFR